jgi:hypothetical protein
MAEPRTRLFLIKIPYWFGVLADTLWAVALFFPPAFGVLIGKPDFSPDLQTRLIMGIGGVLMVGWTLLLLWAVRRPVERRVVILLTAYPVVLGMLAIAVTGLVIDGNLFTIWIIVKTIVLMASMTASYVMACKADGEMLGLRW